MSRRVDASELERIAVLWPQLGTTAAAGKIGRSVAVVQRYVRKVGLAKSGKLWDAAEDATLREWYGRESTLATSLRLSGRTKNQVIGRANRLGLASAFRGEMGHHMKRRAKPPIPPPSDEIQEWIKRQAAAFLAWRREQRQRGVFQ